MKKVTKFTISRKRWIHTEQDLTEHASGLYRSFDKKMCCLGFFGLACGYTKRALREKTMFELPSNIRHPWQVEISKEIGKFLFKSAPEDMSITLQEAEDMSITLQEAIACTNDSLQLSPAEKEQEITRLFNFGGITVKFVP